MIGLVAVAAAQQTPPTYDPARSFAPLVEVVQQAVVTVDDPTAEVRKAGSGFLVSADGLVLTNQHVVDLFEQIQVHLPDGRVLPAKVVGGDSAMDIALLDIEGDGLPWLALAPKLPRVGDRVLTLGSPLGLGTTATAGIVGGTGRNLRQDVFYGSDDYIQTDAAINQGNSGGPLFDLDGRVVGMCTAIIDGVNTVGFAIPAHQLRFAIDEISAHGKVRRGYAGLKATALTDKGAEARSVEGGAVIQQVVKDSPADEAGLKVGDVVTSADGNAIENDRDFMALVGNRKPGTTVALKVLRRDRPLDLTITLGDR